MTAQTVDRVGLNQRLSRTIRAVMAARGVKGDKQLAALSGIKYDTLLRRLNGKPWLAEEIVAVATALDVEVSVLLSADPDGWFRAGAAGLGPNGATSQGTTPPEVTHPKLAQHHRRSKARLTLKSASVRSNTPLAA